MISIGFDFLIFYKKICLQSSLFNNAVAWVYSYIENLLIYDCTFHNINADIGLTENNGVGCGTILEQLDLLQGWLCVDAALSVISTNF